MVILYLKVEIKTTYLNPPSTSIVSKVNKIKCYSQTGNKTIRKSINIPDCLTEVRYAVTSIISSTIRQNLSKQSHHRTYENKHELKYF